jgi:hypothetical protein
MVRVSIRVHLSLLRRELRGQRGRPRSFSPERAQTTGNVMGRFQTRATRKLLFVLDWAGKETSSASFLSPTPTVNSVPRVAPSGSETTLRCTRGRGGTAAREATRLRREVAAWRARSRRGVLAACIPTGEHSCPASPSPSVSLQ